MAKEVEGTVEIGGTDLYCKSWLPEGETKATLIFIHGYSDHSNCYGDFFPYLARRGIAVHSFDQRGWGRSVKKPAEKGASGPTSQVLAEMAEFIKKHIPAEGEPPLFVLGHSMGGGQAIHFAASPEHQDIAKHVRGWLLESPFIGFHPGEEPSALKVAVGRFVGRYLPKFHLVHKLPPEYLSRDKEACQEVENDPLRHNTGTLEGLAGLLDRALHIQSGDVKLQKGQVKSLWVGSGSADKAVGFMPQKEWFEKLGDVVPDKEMKIYDGWFHMLHAEIGKEEYFQDVADWVLARCGPEETGKAKL